MILFLSADQIVQMHDVLMEKWGGEIGVGHRGPYEGVEAAVQAVKNSYYESVHELAAAYAVYIVQGHVFLDGNKRTGAAALVTFLSGNKEKMRVTPTVLQELMLALQQRSESGERTDHLIAWIAGHLS